eukprot:SAG22_NODE_353_length_11812_cov_58.910783_5_plen_183_part_00
MNWLPRNNLRCVAFSAFASFWPFQVSLNNSNFIENDAFLGVFFPTIMGNDIAALETPPPHRLVEVASTIRYQNLRIEQLDQPHYGCAQLATGCSTPQSIGDLDGTMNISASIENVSFTGGAPKHIGGMYWVNYDGCHGSLDVRNLHVSESHGTTELGKSDRGGFAACKFLLQPVHQSSCHVN